MDFIEVSAKTVEDAITKACVDMGLSSDQLEIQVISEGSTGFLGIGSKPAVIQVRKKEGVRTFEEEVAAGDSAKEPKKKGASRGQGRQKKAKTAAADKDAAAEEKAADGALNAAHAPAEAAGKQAQEETEAAAPAEAAHKEKKEPVTPRSDEEVITIKAAATQFLDSVFKAMELPVDLTLEYEQETASLNVNMEGDDMGILIGKRGQTLDSLQYLTSLVVNKDQKDYIRVKLDTEDYRKRRKETLENLAKNIASKVRRNQKPVTLEAMNPYERRIIHSALQSNNAVSTYSEGNEPYRHVVVVPKKGE